MLFFVCILVCFHPLKDEAIDDNDCIYTSKYTHT